MSRATSKFGDYAVHIEWQMKNGSAFQFKHVKKDRKKIATLRKEGTKLTFCIERRAEELVYSKGAWSIPKSLMTMMRCLGSPDVVIHVSNGDTYSISHADLEAKRYDAPEQKLIFLTFVKFDDFAFVKGDAESIQSAMSVGKWG